MNPDRCDGRLAQRVDGVVALASTYCAQEVEGQELIKDKAHSWIAGGYGPLTDVTDCWQQLVVIIIVD